MKKVLLAEDDIDFAGILCQFLELHGFEVCWCKDGDEALALFSKETFSICVLDVMMPKTDGFTLAAQLVEINPGIPFIFLTARQLKEDRIKGLKLGADDYIVKPFEADELVLRLENIIKRSEKKALPPEEEIRIGKYIFNTQRLDLRLGQKKQQLTEKEAALVLFLFQNRNKLLKRAEVLEAVWGSDDFFSGRSMDVFFSRLRKYFSEDDGISVETIRNIGLEFRVGEKLM